MNLTLSVDARVVERARKSAEALGKSLNQVIRDHLAKLAGDVHPEPFSERLRRLSTGGENEGRRKGWKFDREELHDRDDHP